MNLLRCSFVLCLFLGFSLSSLSAAETALSAVQALRDSSRPSLLPDLVEIKGEHGGPQPDEWVLLCNDSTAQGGVRELVIAGHQIVSERTPHDGFGGEGELPRLNLAQVVIDSGSIFTAVNHQAVAHHIGFDSIDYVLRVDAVSGEPLWIVHLYNSKGELVGTMQISAKSGAIVKPLK